jgi:hypothetical protein
VNKVISSKEILQSKEYKALCERFGILSGGVTKAKITLDIHQPAVTEVEYFPVGSLDNSIRCNHKRNTPEEELMYFSGVIQECRWNGDKIGPEEQLSKGVRKDCVARSEYEAKEYLIRNDISFSVCGMDNGAGTRIEVEGQMPCNTKEGEYVVIKTYSCVALAAIVSVLLQRRKGGAKGHENDYINRAAEICRDPEFFANHENKDTPARPIPPETNKERVDPDWAAIGKALRKASKSFPSTKDFAKAMSKLANPKKKENRGFFPGDVVKTTKVSSIFGSPERIISEGAVGVVDSVSSAGLDEAIYHIIWTSGGGSIGFMTDIIDADAIRLLNKDELVKYRSEQQAGITKSDVTRAEDRAIKFEFKERP